MWILLGITMIFTGLNTILLGATLFRIGAIETIIGTITTILYGNSVQEHFKSRIDHPAGKQLPDKETPEP